MVYEGGPSQGCDTCRARKVRCTLEKPRCSRCLKAGFMCLGYLRRSRAMLKQVNYESADVEDQLRNLYSVSRPSRKSKTLPLSPACSLGDRSVNYFLTQFVVISERGEQNGWFDFVPELLNRKDSSVSLNLAIQSVSLLSFANRYHRKDLILQALLLNGRALEAINAALAQQAEATKDGVFAAILLLCLFGHIYGDLRMQAGIHATGLFRLLALREAARIHSHLRGTYVRHTLALLHLDNNDRYLSITLSPTYNDTDLPSVLENKDLFERLRTIWPFSANFLTRFYTNTSDSTGNYNLAKIVELLLIGQQFEEHLKRIAQNLDTVWHCDTICTSNLSLSRSQVVNSTKTLAYHDSWVMAIWHSYRITRISLHTAIVRICELLGGHLLTTQSGMSVNSLVDSKDHSLCIINTMSEEICASIPWSLGKLSSHIDSGFPRASRASLSVAGLRAVANSLLAHQYYVLQAKDALRDIANQFGIRGALS